MAALEVAASVFSSSSYASSRLSFRPKRSSSIKFQLSASAPALFFGTLSSPLLLLSSVSSRKFRSGLHSAVQEIAVAEEAEQTQEENQKRKLYVANLSWSFSAADIKNLFSECGIVKDVEIIKQKDGRNRGFAFITMASGEEARAVVEKFDSYEMSGRIIRVQYAKRLKKPPPPRPAGPPVGETRHKLYVSNLAWKARSSHLREFFSADFNPVSARVIFDSPSGRSAGFGFVSFGTKEEAEAAITALDGKELLGRPLRLKFSEKNIDESGKKEEENADQSGNEQEESANAVAHYEETE